MTIAGSDSGGGAGIQADLKTFQSFGVHGSCVVTAVTAQNSLGVRGVFPIPPEWIERQFEAVMEDIGADAAKIGMLAGAAGVEAVARLLDSRPIPKLVLDPVMAAGAGGTLLDADGVEALRRRLLKKALLVTPNLSEAEALTGLSLNDPKNWPKAAEALIELGAQAALIKGGHGPDPQTSHDLLLADGRLEWIEGSRIPTPHTHGTGCALSAAIAALLARGRDLPRAVREAKSYVARAIAHATALGAGPGPLQHGPGAADPK